MENGTNVNNCWGRAAIGDSEWWSDTFDDGFCDAMMTGVRRHVMADHSHKDILQSIQAEIEAMCGVKNHILTESSMECAALRIQRYPIVPLT